MYIKNDHYKLVQIINYVIISGNKSYIRLIEISHSESKASHLLPVTAPRETVELFITGFQWYEIIFFLEQLAVFEINLQYLILPTAWWLILLYFIILAFPYRRRLGLNGTCRNIPVEVFDRRFST